MSNQFSKVFFMIRFLSFIIPMAVLFLLGVPSVEAEKPPGAKGEGGIVKDRQSWENLSEAEKGKLKEALRRVWSDPAVVSARADIQRASEDYRAAVKNAVTNSDPEIAALLERVQSANEGHMKERIGGRIPGGAPFVGRRSAEFLLHPPGFLESLSEEKRESFRKAHEIARESPEMKKAFSQVDQMRKEDEEFQKKRIEAFRTLRKTYYQEMVKVDPEIEKIMPRGGPSQGGGERGASSKYRKRKSVEGDAGTPGEKKRDGEDSRKEKESASEVE